MSSAFYNYAKLLTGEVLVIFSDNTDEETYDLIPLNQLDDRGCYDAEHINTRLVKYSDVEKVASNKHELEVEDISAIKTGFPVLDIALNDGVKKGQVYCFFAKGTGKNELISKFRFEKRIDTAIKRLKINFDALQAGWNSDGSPDFGLKDLLKQIPRLSADINFLFAALVEKKDNGTYGDVDRHPKYNYTLRCTNCLNEEPAKIDDNHDCWCRACGQHRGHDKNRAW